MRHIYSSMSSDKIPVAYECTSCGHKGIFRAEKCVKCGTPVQTNHLRDTTKKVKG